MNTKQTLAEQYQDRCIAYQQEINTLKSSCRSVGVGDWAWVNRLDRTRILEDYAARI